MLLPRHLWPRATQSVARRNEAARRLPRPLAVLRTARGHGCRGYIGGLTVRGYQQTNGNPPRLTPQARPNCTPCSGGGPPKRL